MLTGPHVAAPADDEQVAPGRSCDLLRGDELCDALDLLRAQTAHLLVVVRIVANVTGLVLLLEAAEAVLQSGHSGDGPGAGEGLRVPGIGHETVGIDRMYDLDRFHLFKLGYVPELGAIAERGVGENEHRCGVSYRDAEGLDGHVEAVGWARRGQDRQRAFPVATGVSL